MAKTPIGISYEGSLLAHDGVGAEDVAIPALLRLVGQFDVTAYSIDGGAGCADDIRGALMHRAFWWFESGGHSDPFWAASQFYRAIKVVDRRPATGLLLDRDAICVVGPRRPTVAEIKAAIAGQLAGNPLLRPPDQE